MEPSGQMPSRMFTIISAQNHLKHNFNYRSCQLGNAPHMNSKLPEASSGAPLRMAMMPPSPKPLSALLSLK